MAAASLPRMVSPTNRCVPVWYIYAQRYRDHHDGEAILFAVRTRAPPVSLPTSALCGLVVVYLLRSRFATLTKCGQFPTRFVLDKLHPG